MLAFESCWPLGDAFVGTTLFFMVNGFTRAQMRKKVARERILDVYMTQTPQNVEKRTAVSVGDCNMFFVFGRLLIDPVRCRGS